MISAETHKQRRLQLERSVGRPILLMGNGDRARNLPMSPLPFRQDSTFLYFTGCTTPGAAALLVDGDCTLFLPPTGEDDTLWHGPTPSPAELQALLGVDDVRPDSELPIAVQTHVDDRESNVAVLAVADENRNRLASGLTGQALQFGRLHGDDDLVSAVIKLRRKKTAEELSEMRTAAVHTAAAHIAVAAATKPASHERALATLFDAVLTSRGCVPGYSTILTQRGEVLHNHDHIDPLQAGRLLLVDGGAEVASGYGCDVTRTWPVSGAFNGRQRAAYEAVLEAENTAISVCKAGIRYKEVHDAASRVLACFLADEGLVRVSPETAVEMGAHALFFPHGVGHLLGMDVHDLENFGDLPGYPDGRARPEQFGTCYLRLDLELQPGWVVTVEPGFYVVPAILDDPKLRQRFADVVDFDRADSWRGFGGIRIEVDVVVTDGTPEILTVAVPRSVEDVEALVGSGPTAEERFACPS